MDKKFTDVDKNLVHVLSDLLFSVKTISAIFSICKSQAKRKKLFKFIKEHIKYVRENEIISIASVLHSAREQYIGQNLWVKYIGETTDELTKDAFYQVGYVYNADEIYKVINDKKHKKEYSSSLFIVQQATKVEVEYLEKPFENEKLDGIEKDKVYNVVDREGGLLILDNGCKCLDFRTNYIDFEDKPIKTTIKKQSKEELLRLYGLFLRFNHSSHIKEYIREDCKYDSMWGGKKLEGKQNIIDANRETFNACIKRGIFYDFFLATIIETGNEKEIPVGTPCLAIADEDDLKCIVIIDIDEVGYIYNIKLLCDSDYLIEPVERKSNIVKIIEGHDSGGSFWISPCNMNIDTKKTDYWDNVEMSDDEISIEEDRVFDFLFYFLLKYFDDDLEVNKNRFEGDTQIKGFRWNLEHNFYTYEQMNKMLDDMINFARLMRDENIDELKEQYPIMKKEGWADIDLLKNVYKNKYYYPCAVHIFYLRFVGYIDKMLAKNPDKKYFSVMGP